LRPAVGNVPKVLAPVAGRPFIDHQLDYLKNQGVTDVVLCTGYGADQVAEHCGNGRRWDLRIRYSREKYPLGTGGAVKCASPLIGSGPFLVLNGDSFAGADLGRLLNLHGVWAAAVTLAVVEIPDRARFGAVSLAGDGAVTRYAEKGLQG